MFARGLQSPHRPILAHVIPIRRCNLSCTYCNEFDDFSKPVPMDEMFRRVDLLAALGTQIVTLSGGEPLLHPEIHEIVRHIRSRGIIATLITNGYLLTVDRIRQLNRAGLDQLQISIDNVNPDDVSKKSLKVLDQKLQWLAQHSEFDVNINSVIGSSLPSSEDSFAVARRAMDLGLTSTVGIIHDHSGQLEPLKQQQKQTHRKIMQLGKSLFSYVQNNRFQKNLVRGQPNDWHCRAGSRYLYVCEDGLVHWCSQQRGRPAIPLERYTVEDLERESATVKSCAPFCTISCVHQTAILDDFRERPRDTLTQLLAPRNDDDRPFELPWMLRALAWMFLSDNRRKFFAGTALRVLRANVTNHKGSQKKDNGGHRGEN